MKRDRERGAAAVEFLLAIPALVLVVFGGVQLGMAVSARGRLADAVGFAARTEAVAAGTRPGGVADIGAVQSMISTRMTGASECVNVVSNAAVQGAYPYRFLAVNATCTLNSAPFISQIVGNFGLTQVSAASAMPIDYEPN